jgi:dTDP-4-amino-4,6-dideoxygalactose transaminase
MQVPFVDLTTQYGALSDEIQAAITAVMARGDFILGREVELLEQEFAAYCGARFAIGVDTGTSALELALRAYGIGPGDEVITAANTFVATVIAILSAGATPMLADVDPCTYNLDPSSCAAAITKRTKAIMPVHLYGHPADMDAIANLAQTHSLTVIEDACQAHGARYKGRRAGSLGDAAAFSFYPAKNLGAYGDAGMVVTDDAQIASHVRMLRNYGQQKKYHHVAYGFNRRLDTLQAAVLRVKLGRLDAWNESRRRIASRYNRHLAGLPVALPQEAAYAEPVYQLYVLRTARRDELQEFLHSQGVATGIHYPIPIHQQPAYAHLGYPAGSFPVTEQQAAQLLSLPMYPELGDDAVDYVAETIAEFFR